MARVTTGRGNARSSRKYSKESFSIDFKNNIKSQLVAFKGNLYDAVLRPACFAGITVLYDEMKIRAPIDEGTLRDSIYRWREKNEQNYSATFYVGVNKRKAAHWWLVEHGHWQFYTVYKTDDGKYYTDVTKPLEVPKFVAAKPYIRPTYDSKIKLAADTALLEAAKRIRELMSGAGNLSTRTIYRSELSVEV